MSRTGNPLKKNRQVARQRPLTHVGFSYLPPSGVDIGPDAVFFVVFLWWGMAPKLILEMGDRSGLTKNKSLVLRFVSSTTLTNFIRKLFALPASIIF